MKPNRNSCFVTKPTKFSACLTTTTGESGIAAVGSRRSLRLAGLLSLSAITLFGSHGAQATSATWTGASNAWSTSSNWATSPATVPGTGDTATFSGTSSNTTVATGNIVINTILFDTASAAAYTLGTTVGTGQITLNDSGAITINSAVVNNQVVNANIILGTTTAASSYSFTNNSATNGQLLTIAGNVSSNQANATRAKTLTLGGSANGLVSGIISGNGTGGGSNETATVSLLKSGTGTWTLSNANTYSGTTTISAGTLAVGAAAPSGSSGALGSATSAVILGDGATALGDGPALLINGAFTVARAISVGSVINTAAYNATIGGSNTTGTSTFSGNITLNNTAANYITTLQAATNGTVDFITGTWTTNNRAIIIGSSGNTGTVKLSNTLATTGGISVNFGTFLLGASNRLGDTTPVTVAGGIFDTGTALTDTTGAVTLTSGSIIGTGTLTGTGSNYAMRSGTVSAKLAGTIGLDKTTSGTITLSGANSYSGTTTIQAGSLAVGAAAPSGSAGALGNATSAVVLGNGSTAVGDAPSLLINGAFTLARAISVGSVANTAAYNATIGGSNTTGTSTYSGAITLNTTAANYTATLQAATGGTVDFTGAWTTNNKAISIGSAGNTGTVKLSNTLATTAGLNINFGTFLLGASDRIGDLTPVTVAGGTLDVGSFSDTVSLFNMSSGFLNGSGTISTATYGFSGGTVNANLGTGTMNVTTGTFNLNGTSAATAVNVNSGTLALGANDRLANGAAVAVAGGILAMGGNSDTVGAVSLAGGSITGSGGTLTGSGYAVQSGSVSAKLGGSGVALTKTTAGTVTLSGANSYTGATTINGGTLELTGTGSIASTNIIVGNAGSSGAILDATAGGLTVGSAQTVSGIGTIKGSTTIQGIIAPGNSAGILNNLGNIDLQNGSTFQMEIGGTIAGTGYDQLSVTGSVTLAGLLAVNTGLYIPNNGDLFFAIANDGTDAIAGKFSNANVDDTTVVTLGGRQWLVSYKADFGSNTFATLTGNDVALMAVPEPNAALIGGIGVLLLLRRRRA